MIEISDFSQHPQTVRVVGNGRRLMLPDFAAELTLTFNGAQFAGPMKAGALASATRASGQGDQYSLTLQSQGHEFELWIQAIQSTANDALILQTTSLGCVPSTGFMTIHALWNQNMRVWVDGIAFDPTIARAANLGPRMPLPQMFHNWLGERRVSLLRWLVDRPRAWTWPLTEEANQATTHLSNRSAGVSPAAVLDALLTAQESRSISHLQKIAMCEILPNIDLLKGSVAVLQLEGCFHLKRNQRETKNWWLFDHHASEVVNLLAEKLRIAQQQTFHRLRSDEVLAD